MSAQMSLLDSTPPCQVIAFPPAARIGRIREVAINLATKSEAAADYYRRQVSDGLFGHLHRLGIPELQQDEMVGEFWTAVDAEILRRFYRGMDGAA